MDTTKIMKALCAWLDARSEDEKEKIAKEIGTDVNEMEKAVEEMERLIAKSESKPTKKRGSEFSKNLNVVLGKDLYLRSKEYADDHRLTMTRLIELALEAYISQ